MNKKNIMKFAESWKNISDEEMEDIKEKISELRKRSTKDLEVISY